MRRALESGEKAKEMGGKVQGGRKGKLTLTSQTLTTASATHVRLKQNER